VFGGIVALLAYVVALMTHFTSASTTILAALLAGMVMSVRVVHPSPPLVLAGRTFPRERLRQIAATALSAWAALLVVSAGAELPLQIAVDASRRGDVVTAEDAFGMASSLRPWDADIYLIAAESLAGAADRGVTTASQPAVDWAERARRALPSSLRAAKALAVGQQYSGDFGSAVQTLIHASRLAPTDPEVFHRLGALQAALGNKSSAEDSLRWAAELDPTLEGVWVSLISLYSSTGDGTGLADAEAGLAKAQQQR
jgi:Flp pilus assembly protein TadD